MAKTTAKRKYRITPGWYQVGSNQVLAAGGSVRFDYSSLSNLISDATTLGKTPMVIAQSIVINHQGIYNATADAAVADIQRLCFYTMNQEIPQIKNKYFLSIPSLAFVRQIGMLMNPAAVAIDSLLDIKKRSFNPFDSIPSINPSLGNAVIPNPDVNKRPNLLTGWRDDENFQEVRSSAGGTPFNFSDVVTLPFCNFSGNVSNDRLPLTMMADPSNPWRVTINETAINGVSIRTGVFATLTHTVTVQMWVYIQFLDNDSAISIGNMYCVAPMSFTSNVTIQPHRYKFYGMVPDYASSTFDNGMPVPYQPFKHVSAVIDNNIRVFDCTVQVFPLQQFCNGIKTIDHCNIGASQNANPWFYIDPNGTTTINRGPGSTLPGNVQNWIPATVFGTWSTMAFFPLLMNHLSIHSFPPNIIAEPGCDADYRITIDGTGGTPTGNVFAVYLDDYYYDDMLIAESYAVHGKMVSGFDNTAWRPLIDNPDSPKSQQAIGLVPVVLNRS